jgi:hypothetical protein
MVEINNRKTVIWNYIIVQHGHFLYFQVKCVCAIDLLVDYELDMTNVILLIDLYRVMLYNAEAYCATSKSFKTMEGARNM